MANLTLEKQKETYARELAAHTLRQWNAVRKKLDGANKTGEDTSSSTSTTSDGYDGSLTDVNATAKTPRDADGEYILSTSYSNY
jgi:hypothetical protein